MACRCDRRPGWWPGWWKACWAWSIPIATLLTTAGCVDGKRPCLLPLPVRADQGLSGLKRSAALAGGQHGHTALSFKTEEEGEWNAGKHGGAKRRLWRKTHIGLDEHTLEIRAVEVTGNTIGDAPVLPDLLSRTAPDRETGSVTADGAYDTGKCHKAITARNASNASAVIAPRKNAKLWQPDTPGARAPKEALRCSKYPGRALAKPDRVPVPKPRRNKDALCEMTWSASCRPRL